jgi:hypothetical protein
MTGPLLTLDEPVYVPVMFYQKKKFFHHLLIKSAGCGL